MIQSYGGAAALLHASDIEGPIFGLRRHILHNRVRETVSLFPGDVLYAVKCNAHPAVLQALYEGGIRHFDTASIDEIRLVRGLFDDAHCHFMHPVKSRAAITEAYFEHGVRRFVIDHVSELEKILDVTHDADDLELFVRLAVPGEGAVLALTGKFGCGVDEAAVLLRRAKKIATAVGITFHVGSQMLDPLAYARAIALAADVAKRVGGIDHMDVGGGFPAAYRGNEAPFAAFVDVIKAAVAEHELDCALQCEPGRLLVADGASVFAKVEMRRGTSLFLNDGVYGHLAEVKWVGPQFPTRMIAPGREPETGGTAFDLFGPTCDSIDSMPGPHWLPAQIQEGSWVEFGMMGAYSNALATGFNGFGQAEVVWLEDDPWHEGTAIEPARPASVANYG